MAYDHDNIFAKILRGEIPCDKIYEDEWVLAFNDIAPQAPIHALVIPKGSYVSVDDFTKTASDAEILGFYRAVGQVTRDLGLGDNGFRNINNTGNDGCQDVPHFHVHILGGKNLGPMLAG